jgi:hypothetical protein
MDDPIEVKEGVRTPIAETPVFPNQFPPEGLAAIVTGLAFVQRGLIGVIVGINVLVTETASVLELGHTVGFGLEVVL